MSVLRTFSAGVDAGSRATKVVVIDSVTCDVVASGIADQGVGSLDVARGLLDKTLARGGVARSEVTRIVATGYGRGSIDFADTTITEITCHARGVHHVMPQARTVIEVGGQDSKLLVLNEDGTVRDFAMNDRCAAGTGRFLEVVAQRLELGLEDLGAMADASREPAVISSTCIVFAETEVIGLLASGSSPEDIIAGIQKSMAVRIAAMAGGKVTPPVAFTGGVALVSGMNRAFRAALKTPVEVVPDPQLTGALGAALLAASRA